MQKPLNLCRIKRPGWLHSPSSATAAAGHAGRATAAGSRASARRTPSHATALVSVHIQGWAAAAGGSILCLFLSRALCP
jgi:hypothetical protein